MYTLYTYMLYNIYCLCMYPVYSYILYDIYCLHMFTVYAYMKYVCTVPGAHRTTYTHAFHTYTYIHTYMHAYIHTYIHTYIYIYIYIYIHLYTHCIRCVGVKGERARRASDDIARSLDTRTQACMCICMCSSVLTYTCV
jgi:hypothetical protein